MTFLNIALLGGVFAINIPLIIHLLNRSRFRVVKWGAMHLLTPIVRVNRKRIRLEQLLLLLVRMMIPLALALCMAAPVLTGCQQLAGNSKSSLVVLLDNSYSMQAGGANSNFKAAQQQAAQMIRDLRGGSDVAVVLMAGGANPLFDAPTHELSVLSDAVTRLSASHGRADPPAALQTGSTFIADMTHPKRDMVVISDFQRVSWDKEQAQARARLKDWLEDQQLMPSLTFLHVGNDIRDNVAVEKLDVTPSVVGVNQQVMVDAHLKNFGDKVYPAGMRVHFEVDGVAREVKELPDALGAGLDKKLLFTHTFDKPGSHVVRVWAEADSNLKEDNEIQRSVQVLDRVPVLLVDGDPSTEPLKSETSFAQIALQPYTEGKVKLADLIEAKVVPLTGFGPANLEGVKAVALANVSRLSDDQLRAMEGFVRGGGGLIVFPGNKVDGDWYNTTLYADGGGMLPMRLAGLSGSLTDVSRHTAIVAQKYSHPALEFFNDQRNGNLSNGAVWSWYRLRGSTDAVVTGPGTPTVLARLDTGDPFLVERRFGDGMVIMCATACDGDWSNLPVRPFYLPLMQQVVTYVASRGEPPRNLTIGQPMIAILPRSAAGAKAWVNDPAGRKHPVPVIDKGSRAVVEYKNTQLLGLYTVEVNGTPPIKFVVDTLRAESDLEQLDDAEISEIASQMGADVVHSLAEYQALDKQRRHGRELWMPLFWLALALLFAELFLQQWMTARKR